MSCAKYDVIHGGDPTCGCCEGLAALTPAATANRPGLDALSYRVGTHGMFLETMMARLSNLRLEVMPAAGEGEPQELYPLRGLTTRSTDDPSIAMLDAWATLADVLTFYQERIANEGYLRTAVERRSLLELGRLVGYAERPGVAASVYLAFTVDDNYEEVLIPAGTRAQSVPEGEGELPQFFETGAALTARAVWNALVPRLARPEHVMDVLSMATPTLYLKGTATNLRPNNALCIGELDLALRVMKFSPDEENERTAVEVERWRPGPLVEVPSAEEPTPPPLIEDLPIEIPVSSSPPEVSEDAIEKLHRKVEPFLDLRAHGVSPGAMAKRVVDTVDMLKRGVAAVMKTEDLDRLLEETVAEVEKEHSLASGSEWAKLADWTGGLAAALGEVRSMAADTAEEAAGADSSFVGGTSFEEFEPQETAATGSSVLFGVVRALATPPSLQPANAQRLARTVDGIFAAEAQLGLELLATFEPRSRQALYGAWENAVVSAPPDVESVEALRVKATPFGATAPLKPIFDENGGVVDQAEWPLADGVKIVIEFPISTFASFDVNVTLDRQGQTLSGTHTVNQGDEGPFDLPLDGEPIAAIRSVNFDLKRLGIDFDFLLSDRRIVSVSVDRNAIGDPLSVSLRHEEITMNVPVGETTRFLMAGVTVEVVAEVDPGPSEFPTGNLRLTLETPDTVSLQRNVLPLDGLYEEILPGTCVLVDRVDDLLVRKIMSVRTVAKAAYGITGKVTELTLNDDWLFARDKTLAAVRNTAVYAQGETLDLTAVPLDPIAEPIAGKEIELDGLYPGLEPGRWLFVNGERTDVPGTEGVKASEPAMIAEVVQGVSAEVPGDKPHTTLKLAEGLAYTYKRDTVTVHANVVEATHGETRNQVLGSGDGSQSGQSFALSFSPLTHVSAPTREGAESTLGARVNDVLWHEAANPADLGPDYRGYTTSTDDDDVTTVSFGDGRHGARLPTGVENVTAEYRQGIGRDGNVKAEQISLLATQPLGAKGVVNPLPATGGADRDGPETMRRNTPLEVMALDRLVSVTDYADFARTFAGVSRASAELLSDGERRLVHVTIAGVDDAPIAEGSALLRNLRAAFGRYGDPYQPFAVEVRELLLLIAAARVRIDPDYRWESVETAVREALVETFGFERRELGQQIVLSEVISTILGVDGVVAADVDVLSHVDEKITPEELVRIAEDFELEQRIAVELARVVTTHVVTRHGETLATVSGRYGLTFEALRLLNVEEVGHRLVLAFLALVFGHPCIDELLEDRPGLEDYETALEVLMDERNILPEQFFTEILPQYRVLLAHGAQFAVDTVLRIPRTVLPAQIAYLSPDLPDTLILTEWT